MGTNDPRLARLGRRVLAGHEKSRVQSYEEAVAAPYCPSAKMWRLVAETVCEGAARVKARLRFLKVGRRAWKVWRGEAEGGPERDWSLCRLGYFQGLFSDRLVQYLMGK